MNERAPRPRVSRRIGSIAESATLAVDAKAKALKAEGRPVIGFGAGEPDFATPDYIVAAAIAAAKDPANHRYTPAAGLPDLKKAIVAKTLRDSHYQVTPEQVLVTNGGKHAVFNTFAALLDPGDEVLLPAPYWTTYPEAIKLAGGTARSRCSRGRTGLPGHRRAARGRANAPDQGAALLLAVQPHRLGLLPEQIREIGHWAVANGIWVVTDEIYEHLTYDGVRSVSMPVEVPELADTCVVVNGVAKTYAMTGWRVGWMIGPRDVIKAATNLQSHSTSNVANVSQRAAIAALNGSLDAVDEMKVAFDRRRRTIVRMLNDIEGVDCPVPAGAFYVYPSVRGLLGKTIRGRICTTSAELAALILDETEVAVVPGEAFGPSGYLRLSYALSDADLTEGVARIQELLGEAR